MGLENVPRCQHIKINGTQCKSPALRRRRLCFFHRKVVEQRARIAADQFAQRPFEAPVLEDANSVQMALMQVMQMLALRRIDHKTSGQMLYALQVASINLRKTDFEVDDATEVVIDRDTVHLTAMNGPQWFEEDFGEDEEDDEEGEEVADGGDDEAEEESADEDQEEVVEAPGVAAKAAEKAAANSGQALGAPKLPAVRAGETPVEALKRILAAAEQRSLSG